MSERRSVAVVFPAAREIEVITETVRSPGPGEVLCEARKSLVSRGTETFALKGEYDKGTYWEEYIRYPFRPGYSMAAEVVEVGAGVVGLKPGDRVTSWSPHQQFFVAPARELFPVPGEILDEEATWATLARTTQLGVRRAELKLGERVGVVGLGILGQLVTQYLALSGPRQIIVIDSAKSRTDVALAQGATDAVNLPVAEARDEVVRLTAGKMLDVVFDITGHAAVLSPASLLVRKLGRLVLLGDSPTPSRQALGPRVVGDSLSILGIHGMMYPADETPFNPWTAAEMTSLFFDYIRSGRMNVKALATRMTSPLDAPAEYHALLEGKTDEIGLIFDWTKLPTEATA